MMRFYIAILQWLFPDFTSRKMYDLMSTPKIRPQRQFKQEILKSAKQCTIPYGNFFIKKYKWNGKSAKTILFVHGWEGETTNFYYLIDGLKTLGYTIVSIDAPSHGYSSKGKTHMFHFSNVLEQQITSIRPNIILSHSFGSMNIAEALQKHTSLSIDLWLMISTPLTFELGFISQAKKYGINDFVQKTLIKRVEKDTQESFKNLSMLRYCPKLKKIKNIRIVQSTADQLFSITWARELQQQISGSKLIELEGEDHYKILKSPSLMKVIATELNAIYRSN